MGPIIIEDKINGKIVRCIFIFKKYSRKDYKEDFKEFVQLQTGKKKVGDFVEYPIYKVPEFIEIPYDYFVEYAPKLFSKMIFYMIKQRPEFILSDELNIQIFLRRIPDLEYYFETMDDSMNTENACFKGAGIWFLYNIVAPFFYFKKINSSIIMRYFLHELTHYVDMVQSLLNWDVNKNYEKKIRNIVGRKSAYGINYLYNSLFNLREEGLADFVARSESPEFNISGDAIKVYNSNLRKLALMRYKKDASKFYFEKISHGNQTLTGEYSIGRNMCLIIALSIAKETNSSFTIRENKNKVSGQECYKKLNQYLYKGNIVYICDLSKKIIAETIGGVRPTAHYYFLKLYEKACDTLDISEDNRAMTQKRFYKLVKQAKITSLDQNRKLVEKEGFIFIQSDITLF